MDLALESSVSANVMRRRGVSNDLRDRGDEWPLLPVVSGLSVVVATVVDEVSMVFALGRTDAALFGALFYGAVSQRCGLAAACTRAVGCAALRTCPSAVQSLDCAPLRPSSSLGHIMLT